MMMRCICLHSMCSFVSDKGTPWKTGMVSLYCVGAGNSMQTACAALELRAQVLEGSARWKGISREKRGEVRWAGDYGE